MIEPYRGLSGWGGLGAGSGGMPGGGGAIGLGLVMVAPARWVSPPILVARA